MPKAIVACAVNGWQTRAKVIVQDAGETVESLSAASNSFHIQDDKDKETLLLSTDLAARLQSRVVRAKREVLDSQCWRWVDSNPCMVSAF